jgi:hypothetical protein
MTWLGLASLRVHLLESLLSATLWFSVKGEMVAVVVR